MKYFPERSGENCTSPSVPAQLRGDRVGVGHPRLRVTLRVQDPAHLRTGERIVAGALHRDVVALAGLQLDLEPVHVAFRLELARHRRAAHRHRPGGMLVGAEILRVRIGDADGHGSPRLCRLPSLARTVSA